MSKDIENNNTPRLRFPEFEGEWEEKKLGEVATKSNKRNKNLEVTRVLTNSANDGVVDQCSFFDREIAVSDKTENYHIVEQNDFVYNPRVSSAAPVGPISVNKIGKGIMSPLYTIFKVHNAHVPFLEYYFQTNIWHSYLKGVANSGARFDRMNVTTEDFFNMPLTFPSLPEQSKIATFLSSLDDLISASQQKVDALREQKKGLMQQMFPHEGEKMPRMRFPGFEGEWEEKKLGEVCDISAGGDVPKDKFSKVRTKIFSVPVISNGVGENAIFGFTDSPKITSNAVSVAARGTIGYAEYRDYPYFPIIRLLSVIPKVATILDTKYLSFILSIQKYDVANAGIPQLTVPMISSVSIPIPSLPEQEKIATFLSSLDDLISAEREKVEALKEQKKGLMQQMFPHEKFLFTE